MIQLKVLHSEFAAAHFYSQKKWDAAKNSDVFGKCFSEHGHGHNYRLEVGFEVSGTAAADLGLQTVVKSVTELLDHKHLNFVVPEFKDLIPTTENIAQFLLKKLQESCPNPRVSYIKLFETDTLWVEIQL